MKKIIKNKKEEQQRNGQTEKYGVTKNGQKGQEKKNKKQSENGHNEERFVLQRRSKIAFRKRSNGPYTVWSNSAWAQVGRAQLGRGFTLSALTWSGPKKVGPTTVHYPAHALLIRHDSNGN